tara:strand:+ start:8481 stop:8876 length:396 start_codon:yes stop_codon:yes gene_type:complete
LSIFIENPVLPIDDEVDLLYSKIKKDRLSKGKDSQGDISLVFVEKNYMKNLNLKYREKDKVTDVLTFTLNEDLFEGEIYICVDVCEEKNLKKWILDRVIHGLLHLDGCHHYSKKEIKKNEERHDLLLEEIF